MRFLTAVALALVMLWVPVDGVTQTQAEREMLQLYESRERQLLASISPEYDESQAQSSLLVCVGAAMSGNPRTRNAAMQDCTRQVGELRNQQAARRRPLEQELFALRQDKVELERRIRLTRASPPPPTQPEARGAPVTVGAGAANDAINQFLNRMRASLPPPPQPEVRGPPVTASAGATVVCSMSAEELGSLRSYAEQGDAVAQAELGSVYGNGNCVPQDYVTAVRWSRSAADQGNARAQSSLGYAYQNGFGVPEDYVEAVRWYRLAAEQGNASAQSLLGAMYGEGQGVPEDYVEAVRLYRLAADQGNALAQNNLGYMYQNGQGVPEDYGGYVEAVRLYRLAADQGNALAQSNLGLMYAQGFGVPEDIVLAYMWFNIAAAQGNEGARNNKDFAEQQMTREQITEAQRLTREWLEAHPPERQLAPLQRTPDAEQCERPCRI